MPHEIMNVQQVASYLHMDARELERLASRDKIPSHRRGGQVVFRKSEVDHWVEAQMQHLPEDRLAQIEAGVAAHHGMGAEGPFVVSMIPPAGIAVPLAARTRNSVLRHLVELADPAKLVYASKELLAAIVEREDLCSTSIVPGVALPHPRHPMPYDIAESFIVVGRTDSGIPFGAADGSLTRLFILICCKDDRAHLHVLARLGRMLCQPQAVESLMDAPDADSLRNALDRLEGQAISCPVGR